MLGEGLSLPGHQRENLLNSWEFDLQVAESEFKVLGFEVQYSFADSIWPFKLFVSMVKLYQNGKMIAFDSLR